MMAFEKFNPEVYLAAIRQGATAATAATAARGTLQISGPNGVSAKRPDTEGNRNHGTARENRGGGVAAVAAVAAVTRQTLPRGLMLKDGRQMYRMYGGRDGQPTEATARLMEAARAERLVLVADNADLVIVVPYRSATSLLRRLIADAANLVAALHLASDLRMADVIARSEAEFTASGRRRNTSVPTDGPEAA